MGGRSEEAKAESDEDRDLKQAGGERLQDGRCGVRIKGWIVESTKRSILSSSQHEEWETRLRTSHLPEMVFGANSLSLQHERSGLKIYFNAFDALMGWKQESLPPVEVPAAAKWKFRCKPSQEVILDYDYTFTTPYCGSEMISLGAEQSASDDSRSSIKWEECNEQMDLTTLGPKEPILFYDEVVLYEDELADSGVSLLTVKVRVMPSCWFLLLRFWLRVDGVLMRLRDTRVFCAFDSDNGAPTIIRESCWREATFQSLSLKGFPSDSAAYSDPNGIYLKLPVIFHETRHLRMSC